MQGRDGIPTRKLLHLPLGSNAVPNYDSRRNSDLSERSNSFLGRYVDWLVTTPLLLLELDAIAGFHPKLIVGAIGADIFMILTGLVTTLEDSPENYLWWTISTGAFLAILASLLTEYSASARRREGNVNSLFQKLRNALIVLWICYPIVWIFGAEGFFGA